MTDLVTDTHAVIWYLSRNKRLSHKARTIFQRAQAGYGHIVVPSIVLVETIFLAQRMRVKEDITKILLTLTEDPTDGIYIYPLNKAVVQALSHFGPAAIPELADRIIAATALHLDLPLLTADSTIQESSLIKTVW
ncbi:MAG: type II toxin-antitoxin system VapC family toxin [Chloroflexi bacterium]|nr:type II toxin-antitoxin system VapC family toxin [Chloroflexota bacterium]